MRMRIVVPVIGLAVWMRLVLATSVVFGAEPLPETGVVATKPEPFAPTYLRVTHPDTNTVRLEIAARQFVPARGQGPVVWLTGVSHIGEAHYYRALQEHLDSQELVLFEGVKPHAGVVAPDLAPQDHEGSLQSTLAESLGLAFQLKAINYHRSHFRNSDLTIPELEQCLRENLGDPGAGEGTTELTTLLALMEGRSFLGMVMQFTIRLLGSSPKLQALAKVALIETVGQLQGDLSQLQGLPPAMNKLMHVLVQRRNQAVLSDLRAALKARNPARSIAIFYGAAHLPDLEKRLRQELAYRPTEEVWYPAISVQPGKAGTSEAELNFVRKLVQAQMERLTTAPAK